MIMNIPKAPVQPETPIQLSPETARGTYCNMALIAHLETEFILDFVFIQPGVDRGEVLSRVLLHPKQAKLLARALDENVRAYEARFGALGEASDIVHRPTIKSSGSAGKA